MTTNPWQILWNKGCLYPRMGSKYDETQRERGTANRRKILFVGHEASRTGAPLILLRLIEAFARDTDAELLLILDRGGPLISEFRQVADVIVNQGGILFAAEGRLRDLIGSCARPAPDLAICNTADTWTLAREIRAAGIPTIVTLLHERLSHYGAEIGRTILDTSDHVVFPAEAVKRAAVRLVGEFASATVLPQGLLQPEFGRGDRDAARRRVREELGIAPDAALVLGCGTRQLRKGVDLFVQLAARVRATAAKPVHFLWLGDRDHPAGQFGQYLTLDIALLDLAPPALTFVPETWEPEAYFLAADAYALTSRDDPFPCVVHEAMACALPVVVFAEAGGAVEAVAEGCGVVVPHLDVGAMAAALVALLDGEDGRAMGARAEARVRARYRFSAYARSVMRLAGLDEPLFRAVEPDDAGPASGRPWRSVDFGIVDSLTEHPLHCASLPHMEGIYLHPPDRPGGIALARIAPEGGRRIVGFKALLRIDDLRSEAIDFAVLAARRDGPGLAGLLAATVLDTDRAEDRPGLSVVLPWQTKKSHGTEVVGAEWGAESACDALVLAIRMNGEARRSWHAQTLVTGLEWQFL